MEEFSNLDETNVPDWTKVLGSNVGSTAESEAHYWAKALGNELKVVAANTEVGDRNQQFFRSCCAIFGVVKAGIGAKADAEDLLLEAAADSGYAADEPEQMMATLASAWRTATPRDLAKKGRQDSASANANGSSAPKDSAPQGAPKDSAQQSARAPAIAVTTGAAPIADQAGQVLEAFARHNDDEQRLFKANTVITRLRVDDVGTRLEPLDRDSLRHEIDRVAHFITKRGMHIGAPEHVVSYIAGAADYNLPVIRGVKCAPYFAADGHLVDQPGYDSKTGYFLELPAGLRIPRVDKLPTPGDISSALRTLVEVTFDFPFADRASKRTYLALLILPFCRDLITGPTPIHVISKPSPGTGAGLAADVFAMISTGRKAIVQTEAESSAEFRKNLTAFLLEGAPYYFLDNLHQALNDPAFAGALTAGFWRDRVLGKSQMVEIPIRNAWIIAGNNPVLSEEIARRSVLISLDAKMADPGARTKFRHQDLIGYVQTRRGVLIWACLTLIQAWVSGQFTSPRRRGRAKLAAFEGWAGTMSGILEEAGVKRLLAGRAKKLEGRTTDAAAVMREFLTLWFATYGQGGVRVGSFKKGRQAENYAMVPAPGTLVELLHTNREIDLGFNGRYESAWQTKMGEVLSNAAGRVFQISDGAAGTVHVRIAKSRGSGGVAYRLERVP